VDFANNEQAGDEKDGLIRGPAIGSAGEPFFDELMEDNLLAGGSTETEIIS
jgi:hypothetical protein